MDKELLALLEEARRNGANAAQMDVIVNAYNSKKKSANSQVASVGSLAGSVGASVYEKPAKVSKNEAPDSYSSLAEVAIKDVITPVPVQQLQRFGKLAQVQKKINNGTVSTKDFADVLEHPEAVPLVETFVKQYAGDVKDDESEIDSAIRNSQLKNRKNYKREEFAEVQQRRNKLVDILNNFQTEKIIGSAGTGGGTANIIRKDLASLFSPDSYESLIENIQSSTSLVSRDGKTKLDKKEVLDLLNQKIADDISLRPVSPEVKSLNKKIGEAAVKWNYKSNANFNPATADQLDLAAAENFENGLEVVKRTDIGKYKNVVRALREKGDVPQTDFEIIAAIGQEIKNKRVLRESSDNPDLIGKETSIGYMGKSRDSQKARIAGEIGEYLKSKGHTNESTFSEQKIRDAAKALKITDAGIVSELVYEEKLIGYDAIPKSGWIPSVIDRGIVAPLNAVANTLTNLSSRETPTETYFRTQDPSGRRFGVQKVPDKAGNMEGKLASDRDNVWHSMLEGAGQMATQVFLTKSIGGAARAVGGATTKAIIGKETTGALVSGREAARAELFGGTFMSTYMQEFGANYEDALNKTGDVGTAKIMGATNAGIAAGFELLLPDAKIFDKAMSGLKSQFVPDFVSLVKKGGDPKLLIKEGVGAFVKAAKGVGEVGNIISQEVLEEVGTTVVSHAVEMSLSPQSAAKVNLGDEVWETIKATAIQTFLPALFGGGGAGLKTNINQKQLHDMALNKEATMKQLDRAKVEGNITDQEFNTAVSLIDTHRKSLITAPLETSDGQRIKREDRLQFALENTSIAMNQARLENEKHLSLAQQDDLKQKIEESQNVQKEIFGKKIEKAPEQNQAQEEEKVEVNQTDVTGSDTTTGENAGVVEPVVADINPVEGDTVQLDSKMGGKNTYTFTGGDWKYKDSRGTWQKLTPKEKEQVEGQFQTQNVPAATPPLTEPVTEPAIAAADDTAEPNTAAPAFKDAHVIGKDNLIDLDNVRHDKPETIEAVRKVVNAVTQLNPDSKFIIHNTKESFDEAFQSVGGRGAAGGFFNGNDGSLHLNIAHAKVNDTTAFHEGAHAIFQYVLSNSETATNNFYDQLQKSLDPIHKESLAKFAGTYNDKGGLTEKDEFVTEFFARVASGNIPLNTTMGQKIKDVLVKFAEAIGLNPDRIGLTSDDNVRDFARKVNKAFHEGKELKAASSPVAKIRASIISNNEKELNNLATANKLSYADVLVDFYNWIRGGAVKFANLVRDYARIAATTLVMATSPITPDIVTTENRMNDPKNLALVKDIVSKYYAINDEEAGREVVDRAVHLWTMFGSPTIITDSAATNEMGKGDKRAYAEMDGYTGKIVLGNISNFDDFVAELSHAAQYVSDVEIDQPSYSSQEEYDAKEYDKKGSIEYDAHKLIEPVIATYILTGKDVSSIIDNKNLFTPEQAKEARQAVEKYKIKPSRIQDDGDRRRHNSRAETKYLEDLTKHYRGTLDPRHQFGLGLPSEALTASGLPDAPLVLRSSTLRYKEGDTYHNLSITEMSDIFSALQNPIAVFQSKTRGDSKVALLETKRGGKNFVAAIEQSRNGENGVNVINSVYPIDNPARVASWIKDDLMEWSDKEKTSEWVSQGQQSNPTGGNTFKGIANIVNSFENPSTTSRIAVRASKLEEEKNEIEKYADKLEAMPADKHDEVDFYDNYQGYSLYVARKIMPKKENSPRFRKVRDGDDAPLFDYEYIANVEGEPYGLVKNEDPDDWENDNAYVWTYSKMSDPDRIGEDTIISDNEELIEHIRANANKIKASKIDEDDTPDTNNAGLLQGLSHEATADTRKFFDLKEYAKSRVTDEELNNEADELIAKGFDIDALIKRIKRGDQPSPAEMVVAIKFKPLLDMQVFDNPSDANISRVEALVDAMDKLGSDEGTRLRLRRKDVANSFLEGGGEATLADFFVREKKAKNGKLLTAKEKEKITREFNEVKKINKQLEKKLAKAQEAASKARAEATLQDRKKYGKKKTKTPEEYAAQRKTVFDRIREKLKNRGAAEPDINVKSSIIEPENKPYLAEIAEDVNEIFEMLVDENPKRTLAEITDYIHSELKDSVEDITTFDVHDIIAGVYDASRTKPTKTELTQRMFELKKEFQKESAQYQGKRNAERLKALKDRYKKQIDEVKSELDSGNFAKEKPKAPPLDLDQEAIDLKDRLIELQHERNLSIAQKEFNNRSGGEKAIDRALDIIGTPRTIMASFDFSAVLRQGLIGVAAHPIIASRAFAEMFRQFASPTKFNRWLYELKESPEYRLMHESKLYIADPNEMRLRVREEVFMSRLVEKVPVIGTWGIKGSERAYVAFLNKMRVDVFNQGAEQLRKAGRTFENAPEEYKALATWVNNMTGRGGYGNKVVELASPILSAAFFSPRFMAARLNALGISDIAMLPATILSGGKHKGFYGKMPSKVRNMALLDMAKFIGFVGTVVGLTKFFLDDKDDDDEDEVSVETDVRSTNFGKIRIGDTRFDLWGGFQQYVTLAGQLITSSTTTGKGKVLPLDGKGFRKTPYEVVLNAVRKKLAPIPSLIVTALDKRNVIGEKLVWKWGGETKPKEITLKDIAASNLLPMIANDVYDTWQSGHEAKAVISGLVAMFGISMQTYKDK